MKIAFIKQKYVMFGGGEAYVAGLMSLCAKQGHDVHLIASDWQGEHENMQFHRVAINKFSRKTRVHSFSDSVKRCVDANNFDCTLSLERTLSQHIWRAGDGLYPTWLRRRALFDSWYKNIFNKYSLDQAAVVKMEERCVRATPHLIANSEMVKNDLLEAYPNLTSQIHVIHNGFDPERFSTLNRDRNRQRIRQQFSLPPEQALIGFVGSGWQRKGLPELMQALALLPDVKLLIAGRDDINRVEKIAHQLGVRERVILAGGVTDIAPLYQALDLTVLPTWFDSFGFVGLESIACGTPYITTQWAGSHEAIQSGVNGYVVSRPDATEELADAIRRGLQLNNATKIAGSISDWTFENNMNKTLDVISKAANDS